MMLRQLAIVLLFGLMYVGIASCYLAPGSSSGDDYAYVPAVSVGAVDQATPNEIAGTLIDQWLSHFKSDSVGIQNRPSEYEVHEIRVTEEHGNAFVITALFLVKPASIFSDWIAGNGVPGEDDWIRSKFLFFKVIREGDVYRLQVIGTGP